MQGESQEDEIDSLLDDVSNDIRNAQAEINDADDNGDDVYFYHPKGVDTLPYYDTLPLVMPFSEDAETFTGINFHYLPPKVRVVLLKNLMDFATSANVKEDTRLKLQWAYIGGISRYRGVNLAVKKYRKDHVQSQFLFIPATQWFNAVMLPVERFNTGPTMKYIQKDIVWQDSMRYL